MNVFTPTRTYSQVADEVVGAVKSRILGRIADDSNNTKLLVEAVLMSGHGDHLEIGTLFGGSAIAVALAKKYVGMKGKVYCVDPLNGYYIDHPLHTSRIDPITRIEVCPEIVMANAATFGVEDLIQVVRYKSFPFPQGVTSRQFASAYIDGDHWGDTPLKDWQNARIRTLMGGYVVFDNCDEQHPSVIQACNVAAKTPGWVQVYRGGITCIVKKVDHDNGLT